MSELQQLLDRLVADQVAGRRRRLRLAAEGRLPLADPLERWLPGSLPPYGEQVSLRQLLNHTGACPIARPPSSRSCTPCSAWS